MDAFYASVEQRDDPSLKGKPVAVGGQPDRRGVVAAASYEARAFGVRSAMSMAKAVRLCPDLRIVRPDFARYKAASTAVFAIFREVTPLVEPLSLDEAYLDVTENAWGEPLATTVARRLKARIRDETRLTASAGVAPNKFLAKIASGWKKPDGLTVISPDRVEPFLQKLPVDALWGVGPVTAGKLRARGIERLVDVRAIDPADLHADGRQPRRLAAAARARHRRPAGRAESLVEVVGFGAHLRRGPHRSRRASAARSSAWPARPATGWSGRSLFARTVTLKVRYADFTTDHPQPLGGADARRGGHRRPRGRIARQNRGGPSSGAAAGRQRPQLRDADLPARQRGPDGCPSTRTTRTACSKVPATAF